jgi:hypothetical protein
MIKSNKQHWRSFALVIVAILGLTASETMTLAQAQGNPNPGVLPINSHPFGHTYGEWSAKWWQWALSAHAATSPLLDTTGANCAEGQSGKVWYLAGTGGGAVTRNCTVPHGKAIFFPIVNVVAGSGVFDCEPTVPGVPCDLSALRAVAASIMDNPMLLQAELDGRPLRNLSGYRVQSPVFSLTYPPDSIFGFGGTFTPQVADGYWIMLAPLSSGTHTLHFRGILNGGFDSDATYFLTIGH